MSDSAATASDSATTAAAAPFITAKQFHDAVDEAKPQIQREAASYIPKVKELIKKTMQEAAQRQHEQFTVYLDNIMMDERASDPEKCARVQHEAFRLIEEELQGEYMMRSSVLEAYWYFKPMELAVVNAKRKADAESIADDESSSKKQKESDSQEVVQSAAAAETVSTTEVYIAHINYNLTRGRLFSTYAKAVSYIMNDYRVIHFIENEMLEEDFDEGLTEEQRYQVLLEAVQTNRKKELAEQLWLDIKKVVVE